MWKGPRKQNLMLEASSKFEKLFHNFRSEAENDIKKKTDLGDGIISAHSVLKEQVDEKAKSNWSIGQRDNGNLMQILEVRIPSSKWVSIPYFSPQILSVLCFSSLQSIIQTLELHQVLPNDWANSHEWW